MAILHEKEFIELIARNTLKTKKDPWLWFSHISNTIEFPKDSVAHRCALIPNTALMTNKKQVFILTNDGLVYRHIYASLDIIEWIRNVKLITLWNVLVTILVITKILLEFSTSFL